MWHRWRPADPSNLPLAPREFEVFQLLVQGCSLEEVGRRLQLSVKTVANYQTSVRQKLGAATAIELLHVAQRHGLAPASAA